MNTRKCTANYEKCTKIVVGVGVEYCRECLDMEVQFHKRRIAELTSELDEHKRLLSRLGSPVQAGAVTMTRGREESWLSKTVAKTYMPADQYPLNGLVCSICELPQYATDSGPCCMNGHGGAPGVEP